MPDTLRERIAQAFTVERIEEISAAYMFAGDNQTRYEIMEWLWPLVEQAIREEREPKSADACSGCGGPHPFDTSVPSVLWNRVIRSRGINEYLCATCIVREFAVAGVSFTAELTGDEGDPISGTRIAVTVNDDNTSAEREVTNENNSLRVDVRALNARIDVLRTALAEEREKARVFRQKIQDYRENTRPRSRSRAEGNEVANIQGTLNVVVAEFEALWPAVKLDALEGTDGR